MKKKTKQLFKSLTAFLLLAIMVLGSQTVDVLAAAPATQSPPTNVAITHGDGWMTSSTSFIVPTAASSATPTTMLSSETEGVEEQAGTELLMIRFMGEYIELPDDGIVLWERPIAYDDNIGGASNARIGTQTTETIEHHIPRYIFFDGERIRVDDPRISNIIPTTTPVMPLTSIAPLGVTPPATGNIMHIYQGAVDQWPYERVTMNGRAVSPLRYTVQLTGTFEFKEVFCVEPWLAGPEDVGQAGHYGWQVVDTLANPQLLIAMRYGFPNNPYLSCDTLPHATRVRNAYITRVAIAMATNPGATFGGNQDIRNAAQDLLNNPQTNFDTTKPAIAVNNVTNAEDFGRVFASSDATVQSIPFDTTYNRRFHHPLIRFRFEWAAGTPAGARLVVNGNTYVAPIAPSTIFGGLNDPVSSFHIEMDNTSANEGQVAKVYMIGVTYDYAGHIWRMVNPNVADSPDWSNGWQDLVFYIPRVRASAAFSFERSDEPGIFRILKTDMDGQPRGGAQFTIDGPDPSMPMTITVPVGGWTSPPLALGEYTITEIQPPPGGYLIGDNPTQTVTITEGQTETVTLTFRNPRYENGNGGNGGNGNGVTIQKICAITRENIPGALMRLRGMSAFYVSTEDGQMIYINNTGINASQVLTEGATTAMPGGVISTVRDGVWILEGLPYGFFQVEEERAPEGFSLYPQHTAFGFWKLPPNVRVDSPDGNFYIIEKDPLDNHVLITFENFPFSEIVIYKREVSNGVGNNQLLAGATFRIQGYYPGNPAIPIDRVATTGADGRVVFSDLPAGHFTITEIQPPTGYLLGENNVWTVNIGWGQTVAAGTANSHTFFNVPKSSLEILKICGVTNEPLQGAIFELLDPTTGESWQATSGTDGIAVFGRGSYGNFLYPNRTYIIREIVAPDGFVLMDGPREIVLSPGDENRITWLNWQNPGLTIIKLCQDTGERLEGAHFTIEAQGSGRPLPTDFPMITDANGEIFIPWTLFEGEAERNFIVTEIVPPPGFHLSDPNWQLVTLQAGYDNTVVFRNRRMPTLTIEKTDSVTGAPIMGAEFTIERLSPAPTGFLTGSPFRTDAQGRIILPDLPAGVYRIIETRAANNYWLDPQVANRTWTITIRENEDYLLQIQNTLLPSLIITKMCSLSFRPVPLTHFRVYYEVPNSPNVQLIGNFVTDSNGRIILPFVQVGWYRFIETRPAPGMSLATNNSFRVFLSPGQNSYQLIKQGIIQSDSMIMPGSGTGDGSGTGGGLNPGNPGTGGGSNDGYVYDFYVPYIPEQIEELPPTNVEPHDDIDYNNIEIVYDAALVAHVTSNMVVTGGNDWLSGEYVWNWPLNSIVIKKTCSVTRQLLGGATFEVIHTSAGISGTLGTVIGRFTTDPSGIIVITGLVPGSYVVREVTPPRYFTLSETNTQTVFLQPDGHSVVEVVFANDPYGGLLIVKRCEVTGNPLHNAEFEVRNSSGAVVGTANGRFTTNLQGEVLIPNLRPDSYVVTEVRAPDGFELNSAPQTIRVNATGQIYRLEFTNRPLSSLIIRKLDGYDGGPLARAIFEVRRQNGEWVGEFETDADGTIVIPGLLGWFIVTETQAPPGFALDPNATRTVEVRPGAPTVVTFRNPRLGSIVIEKVDGNGAPLAGAQFRVTHQNGQLVGNFTSPGTGMISIPNLPTGWFNIEETRAPEGFVMAQGSQTVEVRPNTVAHVTFVNYEKPTLVIEKVDESGRALAGAVFEVRRPNGELISRVTSNAQGIAHVGSIEPGAVIITETRAPDGFMVIEASRTVELRPGENRTERFVNARMSNVTIRKISGDDGRPLAGVVFEVTAISGEAMSVNGGRVQNPVNNSFEFVTDSAGMIIMPRLQPGTYVARETRALPGYQLAEPYTFVVTTDRDVTITIRNYKMPSVVIRKICGETGRPLSGVVFEIARYFGNGNAGERLRNPVNGSVEFVTDAAGLITLANMERGTFAAIETRPLPGFIPANPVIFTVGSSDSSSEDMTIIIRNYPIPPMPDYVIRKISGDTGRPLAGVVFEIAHYLGSGRAGERLRNPANGSVEFVTDVAGNIYLRGLEPGNSFVAIETRALPGYALADPVVFVVGDNQDTTIIIRNYKLPTVVIRKICGDTGRPLEGVEFEFARYFGNGNAGQRLKNKAVDSSTVFRTDRSGHIYLPNLEHGTWIAIETRPLPGFMAADPVIFNVGINGDETIIIRNYRYSNLTIKKINSLTRAPLEGVHFEISRPNGTRVRNPQTGFYTFITDRNGLIHLPVIEDGRYYLRETRALPGFLIDHEIIAFSIDSAARQREHVLVVENTPASGLLIIKTCAQTGYPLQGVEFEVRYADGRLVTGLILDANQPNTPYNSPQLAANGLFLTDHRGRIELNHLQPGVFHVRETRALDGFELDTTTHVVTVLPGQQAVLEVTNRPLSGLRLHKVCAWTGVGLFNVEFMVFDHNGHVVGVFYTDNNGLIDFGALLVEGRYTIRETRPAPGFFRDDVPRTIELVAGRVTEITWENIPYAGQIQIRKVSADFNEINGFPAGTPLQGAIFEILDWRTGNVVDRIISGVDGMAVSRPLPLGRYRIREVQAPAFYKLNPAELDVTIEFATQIIRAEVANQSANVGVSVSKTGPREVVAGQNLVVYNVVRLRNDSTIPLTDFFFRDVLPTDAFRIERLVTGTFNQSLRYRVEATTNTGRTIIVNDNLHTTRNNVLDMRPAALGLASNEFVTEFIFIFGQVPAGFSLVEHMQIEGRILNQNFPNGFEFANRVDAGGRTGGEWIISGDTVVTILRVQQRTYIPRTGQ